VERTSGSVQWSPGVGGWGTFPAEPRRAADCRQRPLCSRFRQQLTPGVGADASRRANGARGLRPRVARRKAPANTRLERTPAPASKLTSASAAQPRAPFGRVTRELILCGIYFLPLFLAMASELDSNLTVIPIVVLSSYGSG
jgi:hypothetical protein